MRSHSKVVVFIAHVVVSMCFGTPLTPVHDSFIEVLKLLTPTATQEWLSKSAVLREFWDSKLLGND